MLFAEYLDGIAFQSTLPQGERQMDRPQSLSFCAISIHAPTRGATISGRLCVDVWLGISIHAPTRGATKLPHLIKVNHKFQSTLPQGERRQAASHLRKTTSYFNPRSHKGSDIIRTGRAQRSMIFQSTLPQGERQRRSLSFRWTGYFNPRSHKGSDEDSGARRILTAGISIHAPTRGATGKE